MSQRTLCFPLTHQRSRQLPLFPKVLTHFAPSFTAVFYHLSRLLLLKLNVHPHPPIQTLGWKALRPSLMEWRRRRMRMELCVWSQMWAMTVDISEDFIQFQRKRLFILNCHISHGFSHFVILVCWISTIQSFGAHFPSKIYSGYSRQLSCFIIWHWCPYRLTSLIGKNTRRSHSKKMQLWNVASTHSFNTWRTNY